MPGRQYIGGSELVCKPVKMAFVISSGTLADNDRLRSVLIDDGIKFGDNRIQGVIPANSLPTPGGFSHGVKNSVGMIGQLGNRQSFAAQRTVADRRFRIAFDFGDLTVLHMGNDTAPPMTLTAGRSYFFNITHLLPPQWSYKTDDLSQLQSFSENC